MPIPTEPIGSIPRTPELIRAFTVKDCDDPSLAPVYEAAIRDTVARFEAAGSPIVTDGGSASITISGRIQCTGWPTPRRTGS